MKEYIGTKCIEAEPEQKNGEDGYKVVYEDGYESWSPKEAFEKAYRKSGEMSFGHALEMLKRGKKVARKGWNGKGMYLYLADGKLLTEAIGDGSYPFTDTITMKTADDKYCIGWLASQTDMLAEDWEVLD